MAWWSEYCMFFQGSLVQFPGPPWLLTAICSSSFRVSDASFIYKHQEFVWYTDIQAGTSPRHIRNKITIINKREAIPPLGSEWRQMWYLVRGMRVCKRNLSPGNRTKNWAVLTSGKTVQQGKALRTAQSARLPSVINTARALNRELIILAGGIGS